MSSDDEGEVRQNMETGRVARYFLYRNREKQPVRRAQMKTVLDQFRGKSKKSRNNPIKETDRMLAESLGLKISCPDEKGAKYFVTRTKPYPRKCELPFSLDAQKEYGLLMFAFFIIYFKNDDGIEVDQLRSNLEQNSGLICDDLGLGSWSDLVTKWASQDYIKISKTEDENDPTVVKRVATLGLRFHAEFGTELLLKMAKELIFDQTIKEEEDEEDRGEAEEEEEEADSAKT